MQKLAIRRRLSRIHECGGDTPVLDFLIDGVSIVDRARKLRPTMFDDSRTANPDGPWVGVTEWTALMNDDLFLSGRHPHYTDEYEGMVPLLVCSDCGMSFCGGVWTRIRLMKDHVTWSGLGFPSEEGFRQLGAPVAYSFERSQYERAFREAKKIAEQVEAQNPSTDVPE